MSQRHKVDRWLMVLTTKEASYIIVLGIVISVLPISSILLKDGYHVRFKQNSKQRRRGANQTLWISSKQMCPINQFAFRRQSRCHFHDHSRDHFRLYRGHFRGHSQLQSRVHFRVQFRSFPLQHTASRWRASAVALWSSRRASQLSVRSSSRSLHL